MTRGFITLAVGKDSYYELAYNLLLSYRETNEKNYPWTLVCDRENRWTTDFDNVILLDNPSLSYMDKLTLFGQIPYDECIFIDADCLVFENIESLWDKMENIDGFSCFGKSLALDSKEGWFLLEDIGELKKQISYIPQMHGGICFLKKGEKLDRILALASWIEKDYSKYKFKYFEKPADEPILALAMAIVGSHPVKAQPNDFIFLPTVKNFDIRNVILNSCARCTTGDGEICEVCVVHFQNYNTKKTAYKVSRDILLSKRRYSEFLWYAVYSVSDWIRPWCNRFVRLLRRKRG